MRTRGKGPYNDHEYYAKNKHKWRERELRISYGMTLKDYAELLDKQNGVCAICGQPPKVGKVLHVDHNHDTGKVRGLLCSNCNTGLGLFDEARHLLLTAAEYLR